MKLPTGFVYFFLAFGSLSAKAQEDYHRPRNLLAFGILGKAQDNGGGGRSGGKGKRGKNDKEGQVSDCESLVGCVEALNGTVVEGNRLVLGDCSDPDVGLQQEGKSVDRFRSRSDKNLCLDVGDIVEDNVKLVLMPCDKGKPSQSFTRKGIRLHPSQDESMCVTYRGFTPNVYEDKIILKPCETVVRHESRGADKDFCFESSNF